MSTAKKSKTTTFSRVFHPKKIDNFLGKSKLNFWTKNEDFEHCDCYCSWTLWLLERTSISLAVASLLMEESLWLTISKQSQLTRIPLLALQLQVSLPSTYDFDHSFENLIFLQPLEVLSLWDSKLSPELLPSLALTWYTNRSHVHKIWSLHVLEKCCNIFLWKWTNKVHITLAISKLKKSINRNNHLVFSQLITHRIVVFFSPWLSIFLK